MIFLRRQLPLLITMITGLRVCRPILCAASRVRTAADLGHEVAADHRRIRPGLGVTSLFHQHAVKIRRQEAGWGYSLVLYAGMLVTIMVGLWGMLKRVSTAP